MKPINILCATDEKFAPYCGIMLTSLLENNRNHQLCTYILVRGLSAKNSSLFSLLAERYNTPIHIVQVPDEQIAQYPVPQFSYWSCANYFRLLAPELLPPDVERVIYLDSDMIVDGDIESLWNENVENVAFGAVLDPLFSDEILKWHHPYAYNTGMLLMNLVYWRSHSITERCLDYIKKTPNMQIVDQEALYHVVVEDMVLLPIRYNFQSAFLLQERQWEGSLKTEIEETICSYVILHYSLVAKPWLKYSYDTHPYRFKYLYYRSISLWKDYPLVNNWTIPQRFLLLLYRIACAIGIRQRSQTYIIPDQKYAIKKDGATTNAPSLISSV
ncbi:MAG: glycosyltransferase family 8 protein [Prevotellaceae bacterium]|jgi:lipopolysaccharide biosynthesis glycosyltransferase|nr:glycosyltransferase family 8 protein [Prevotellaceae bacterium]